jgi:hypothetical protein
LPPVLGLNIPTYLTCQQAAFTPLKSAAKRASAINYQTPSHVDPLLRFDRQFFLVNHLTACSGCDIRAHARTRARFWPVINKYKQGQAAKKTPTKC